MLFHDCNENENRKPCSKKNTVMQCHTQVGNITTNLKGKIDFTLTELRTTKNVTWNYHVDDFAKGIYEMILGRDLLKELGINIKLSQYVIEAYD